LPAMAAMTKTLQMDVDRPNREMAGRDNLTGGKEDSRISQVRPFNLYSSKMESRDGALTESCNATAGSYPGFPPYYIDLLNHKKLAYTTFFQGLSSLADRNIPSNHKGER